MAKLELKGCGTALITPFRDGAVDYEAFRSLVKRQIKCGIDFLVPLGTTGETPCLSLEERIEILRISKQECQGRPVIVGGGTNSLEGTLASMRELEPYGPDAFLIVVPYYNKPTQEGMYRYFRAVAESTSKPIILYNVPGRTGANMQSDTVIRLAKDCPNVVAVKEASGSFAQASAILREAPEGFSVLSGDDMLTLPFMAAGASGIISVASNVVPMDMARLAHLCLNGDFSQARKLHHKLSPLFKACFVESNPIPAKAALSQMGLIRNELRLPLVPASEQTEKVIAEVLKALAL